MSKKKMGYHQTFVGVHPITSILLTIVSLLLHFGNSFVCPPGTRALCCLSNPFINPNSNKVYQHCQLWLEYFNKAECRDKAGHVCCEEPFDIALGICETDQEPDSCPPYFTPPPHEEGGDGPSPGNSIDPPGSNGGDRGNGNGWWPPKPGPWPNRPSGLWKLKKRRRGCDDDDDDDDDDAAATPPPHSLKLNDDDDNDDDEDVVAVLAEPEKAPTPMQKYYYTTESEMKADNAQYIAPSRGVQDSFLDLDFAASASCEGRFCG